MALNLQPNRMLKMHPIVMKIKSKYLELLKKGLKVKLIWIPGHYGIPGNDRADAAVKTSTQSNTIHFPSYHDYIPLFKRRAIQAWQFDWDCSSEFKDNRIFRLCPKIPLQP
jgi:hypothetical protein